MIDVVNSDNDDILILIGKAEEEIFNFKTVSSLGVFSHFRRVGLIP